MDKPMIILYSIQFYCLWFQIKLPVHIMCNKSSICYCHWSSGFLVVWRLTNWFLCQNTITWQILSLCCGWHGMTSVKCLLNNLDIHVPQSCTYHLWSLALCNKVIHFLSVTSIIWTILLLIWALFHHFEVLIRKVWL